jgi:hypothetical protein
MSLLSALLSRFIGSGDLFPHRLKVWVPPIPSSPTMTGTADGEALSWCLTLVCHIYGIKVA